MPTMTEYNPGTFSWVDLSTTDQEGAKRFYSELFGWTSVEMPMAPGQTYSIMRKDGKDVAAISVQMNPGAPPVWNSYVTVKNVDASTEKAKALGGNVIMGPMDVMGAGRMSVIQDPTGAYFSIWEPGTHIGAGLVNDPGCFSWNELLTRDLNAATTFYSGLFDWKFDEAAMPDGNNYTTIKNQERMNGGMLAIRPEMGPMPANWMVYFSVTDCDAACEKIKQLGGKVLMEPKDLVSMKFAVVQDPQGGAFYVISMSAPM